MGRAFRKRISFRRFIPVAIFIFILFFGAVILSRNNFGFADDLNPIIDVGDEVYVQHDENKQDRYLLTSEGAQTVVYNVIPVKYTASHQWTEDGQYVEDFTDSEHHYSATAPSDYISVHGGEQFFVRIYGVNDLYTSPNNDQWTRTVPILFLDDQNNVIDSALRGTYTNSKEGVEITVPNGATRMHITNYNYQDVSIQKKITLNSQQFAQLKAKQDEILNSLDNNYQNVKNNPVIYSDLEKSYVAFVLDDSRYDMDQFADLFIEKNVPLSLATIPDALFNIASNHTETRQQVAQRVQDAGGEILVHNTTPIRSEDTANDDDFIYDYFVGEKQKLASMGFDTDGIILAGGNGDVLKGNPLTAKWAYSLYKYSDLLGDYYNGSQDKNSFYYYWRSWLGDYKDNSSRMKSDVDNLANNSEFIVYYFHDTSEISVAEVSAMIDYIKSKGSDKIEFTTYRDFYQQHAKRESELLAPKTYYVSANGTSRIGTNINDPTNIDYLNNKEIHSGDTILFKRGDTFYGSIDLQTSDSSDNAVTISSYGEGDLPTISAARYVNKKWEKYSDGIYRIDILNNNNFTGYKYTDEYSLNIGFIEDNNGTKYFRKQPSIDRLTELYDFYSDNERYVYIRSDSEPYETLGGLKLASRVKLFILHTGMDISNLRLSHTGAHAFQGSGGSTKNIKIHDCVIEDIGGSYLDIDWEERYGNGIEFYQTDTENVDIYNNIVRNVYDVAFTIQGDAGSGKDVLVHDNVFVANSQDSEIWEDDQATGINNYQFYNNISINQGRGWGYDARPDQDAAGNIIYYAYSPNTGDMYYHHNLIYNPVRVYAIHPGTQNLFINQNFIRTDYNTFYMDNEAYIYRYSFRVWEKDDFISWANKDANSTFNYLETPDQNIINVSSTSDDIETIRRLFDDGSATLTFHANDNTNTTATQTFNKDENFQLRQNTFTRSGYIFKGWNTQADGHGTSYQDGATVSFSKNTDLYAVWQKKPITTYYTIKDYEVDEKNHYISRIMVNTTVNELKSHIIHSEDLDIAIDNIDGLIHTGGKTKMVKGQDTYAEYTNVVIGDINGDAKINSADLLKVRQHVLGQNILTGYHFLSSDINYDSTINSADLLRVRQHLLGTKLIK